MARTIHDRPPEEISAELLALLMELFTWIKANGETLDSLNLRSGQHLIHSDNL